MCLARALAPNGLTYVSSPNLCVRSWKNTPSHAIHLRHRVFQKKNNNEINQSNDDILTSIWENYDHGRIIIKRRYVNWRNKKKRNVYSWFDMKFRDVRNCRDCVAGEGQRQERMSAMQWRWYSRTRIRDGGWGVGGTKIIYIYYPT